MKTFVTLVGIIGLFLTQSCQNREVEDVTKVETQTPASPQTSKFSFTRHTVLAESSKTSVLHWGEQNSLIVNGTRPYQYRVRLTIGGDCNMGIYFDRGNGTTSTVIWKTNTNRAGNFNPWLVAQNDGNLVLYSQNNYNPTYALWASGTNGSSWINDPKFKLQLLSETGPFIASHTIVRLYLEHNGSDKTVVEASLPYGL